MKSHFEILKQILNEKIIAIVRLDSAEYFIEVAKARKAGGISVI
jgi:2-keto-3-deoxy-6-phosphogluconate aldolase